MKVDLEEYDCPICGSPNITLAIRKTVNGRPVTQHTTQSWVVQAIYCNEGSHAWRRELD